MDQEVTFYFVRLWQVIIVTSSLMKDMNSKTDLYRANAIRVLCRITDGGLLGQIERYLKQAVVDKNIVVSSAALVSGIHLLQVCYLSGACLIRLLSKVSNSYYLADPGLLFHLPSSSPSAFLGTMITYSGMRVCGLASNWFCKL